MSQVRKQPLPIGRYWLDVLGRAQLDKFSKWAKSNPTRIRIELTEPSGTASDSPVFVIFNVLKPTRFDQRSFGFPTEAGPEIQHASDTVQRPKVETPLDVLSDAKDALFSTSLVRVGLICLLVYALTQTARK